MLAHKANSVFPDKGLVSNDPYSSLHGWRDVMYYNYYSYIVCGLQTNMATIQNRLKEYVYIISKSIVPLIKYGYYSSIQGAAFNQVPYGSKFPWSSIFVIFMNFAMITKLFVTKFS